MSLLLISAFNTIKCNLKDVMIETSLFACLFKSIKFHVFQQKLKLIVMKENESLFWQQRLNFNHLSVSNKFSILRKLCFIQD